MSSSEWSKDLFGKLEPVEGPEDAFEREYIEAEKRAEAALYSALVSSGMAEKVIAASHHTTVSFNSRNYPRIEMQTNDADIMYSADGAVVVPRFIYVTEDGRTLQPVTLKFERQYKTTKEAVDAARTLWSNVSEADKLLLVQRVLADRKESYQFQKKDCEKQLSLPESEIVDREGEEMYLRQANAYIAVFTALEQSIPAKAYTFVYDSDGGLRIRLNDESEIKEILEQYRREGLDEPDLEE